MLARRRKLVICEDPTYFLARGIFAFVQMYASQALSQLSRTVPSSVSTVPPSTTVIGRDAVKPGATVIDVGINRRDGRGVLVFVMRIGMFTPTVVVGLFIFALVSRRGPLGSLDLIYTKGAIIAGEFLLAFPVIVTLTHGVVAALLQALIGGIGTPVDPVHDQIGDAAICLGYDASVPRQHCLGIGAGHI